MANPSTWLSTVRSWRQAELISASIASVFWAAQFRKPKSQLSKHLLCRNWNRWVVEEFSIPRADSARSRNLRVYVAWLWQPAWNQKLRFQLPTRVYDIRAIRYLYSHVFQVSSASACRRRACHGRRKLGVKSTIGLTIGVKMGSGLTIGSAWNLSKTLILANKNVESNSIYSCCACSFAFNMAFAAGFDEALRCTLDDFWFWAGRKRIVPSRGPSTGWAGFVQMICRIARLNFMHLRMHPCMHP